MVEFALNHMSVARASFVELLDIASHIGCVGVEVRNDLPQPLFDGIDPVVAGQMVRDRGLRLLAVAEVKQFNVWSDEKASEAHDLIAIAKSAGSEAVSLIPRNDNGGMGNGERQANLRLALRNLKPMLEEAALVGLVEPLGFEICPLRYKREAIEAIQALDGEGTFRIVHDTFHHHLAHGGPIFPAHTGIVHISGVVDPSLSTEQMGDQHRILVDGDDRLGNIQQIAELVAAGYSGPISFEAFSEQVHSEPDPVAALNRSIDFIRSRLTAIAA